MYVYNFICAWRTSAFGSGVLGAQEAVSESGFDAYRPRGEAFFGPAQHITPNYFYLLIINNVFGFLFFWLHFRFSCFACRE